VLWLFVVGIAGLGQACVGGTNQDRPVDVTQPRDRPPAGPKPPIRSTGGAADWTLTGPAFGEVRRPAVFRVTLNGAVHPKATVRLTPSVSNGDGVFSPAFVDLSDSVRSGWVTYTPTRWGKRTIAMTNDGGLRDPESLLEFVAKVQVGSSGTAPSGNRGPDLGGFDFFAKGPWWQELGRSVLDDPVAPDSDALVAGFGASKIRVDWETTTARGGNSIYGIPYNVVPGDQPLVPITLGAYGKESDPGPVPFFLGMSIENWSGTGGGPPPETRVKDGGDHHALVARRDEATGGIDRLYEYYQVASDDEGATWKNLAGGARFDLTTGAPRPEFWTSADAAGLPMLPLLVRYDEAARGEIKHPFRVCISPGLSRNRLAWPARHAVYSGSPQAGLPMGARLRLKRSWYDAHRAGFSPINRAIIDAMRDYGVIVADLAGGGLWLNGVNDERWDHNDLAALRTVPVAAFEVLDTIKPPVRFSGPTRGQAGIPHRFGLQHLIAGDSHFASSLYLNQSSDGGKTWSQDGLNPGWFKCDDTHRGPFILTFTPPAQGTYILRVDYGGKEWIEPPRITFTATAATAAPRQRPLRRPTHSRPQSIRPTAPGRPSRTRSWTPLEPRFGLGRNGTGSDDREPHNASRASWEVRRNPGSN
jgi:hypothetical protein